MLFTVYTMMFCCMHSVSGYVQGNHAPDLSQGALSSSARGQVTW